MKANSKKKILLFGGGGHCHSVIDSILSLGIYDEIGIVDKADCSVLGIPVVGIDDDIDKLKSAGWTDAFITVGSIGNTRIRRKLYEMLKNCGMNIPTIIDPAAMIARGTNISEGTYVGKSAIVNTETKVGICAIINTGSIIEHDCMIGDFSHVSSGAIVCGQVNVGRDSHVGAGAIVRQQIVIGDNSLIGAGSVVVEDIPDNVKAYGNPCKVVRK